MKKIKKENRDYNIIESDVINFKFRKNQNLLKKISMVVVLSMLSSSSACMNSYGRTTETDFVDDYTTHSDDIDHVESTDVSTSDIGFDTEISDTHNIDIPVSTDSSSETIDTYPTKNPNPSSYADYLDIPMPSNNKIDLQTMTYNGQLINILSDNEIYLLFTFGFDNPVLLNNLRSVLGDETVTSYEVDYFQHFKDYIMQYSASFDTFFDKDFYRGPIDSLKFELDIARYILEENGLRMWIDEIPYDFFDQKLYNYYASAISLPDDELNLTTHISNLGFNDGTFKDFSSAKSKMSESEFNEVMSELFYASGLRYNTLRYLMIYDLGANQIRNTDGYNVIQFADEKIYNKVREAYKDFYGYDFDPIHNGPETREDLANNYFNIPVEEFDEAAKAIGGVKFERTNPYDQTYDQSRGRG